MTFTSVVHIVQYIVWFLSDCVTIAICSCLNSIVSHSTLLSTSPLNKHSCPLPGPVDFAKGSGEQQWFSYLLFVILSAVCVSPQTAADYNIFPFWFLVFILMGWSGECKRVICMGFFALSRCCTYRGGLSCWLFPSLICPAAHTSWNNHFHWLLRK